MAMDLVFFVINMDQNRLKESSHFVLRDDVSFFAGHNISWPHMTPLRSPTYALIRHIGYLYVI